MESINALKNFDNICKENFKSELIKIRKNMNNIQLVVTKYLTKMKEMAENDEGKTLNIDSIVAIVERFSDILKINKIKILEFDKMIETFNIRNYGNIKKYLLKEVYKFIELWIGLKNNIDFIKKEKSNIKDNDYTTIKPKDLKQTSVWIFIQKIEKNENLETLTQLRNMLEHPIDFKVSENTPLAKYMPLFYDKKVSEYINPIIEFFNNEEINGVGDISYFYVVYGKIIADTIPIKKFWVVNIKIVNNSLEELLKYFKEEQEIGH